MPKFLDIFKKKEASLEGGATLSIQLRRKFGAFKKLLTENKKILEIITELEEKYAGEYLFDRQYLRARVKELSERVYSLIRELNELSESPYTQLYLVYEQIHQSLNDLLAQRRAIPADPFVLFKQILDQVVPLNLIDPTDPGFLPKNCRTFHDITRFVHQKGSQEMFSLSSASSISGGEALQIETSLPLEIYLVDLGNCISQPAGGSKVKVEGIHSWPLQALWKGIASMKWPGPKPLDVKGFASVVAQTATAGGEAEKIYSDKSFVLVSEDYMNFNVRLGYHRSTIEAFGDSGEIENYIKFLFKGGGATLARRARRARLIAAILEKLGFQVNRKSDLVDAGLFHHTREAMEGILTNLGKLALYTKQLDMVMYNEAIVDRSIEEFYKEHLS
jgi:pyruvate,water dikinase